MKYNDEPLYYVMSWDCEISFQLLGKNKKSSQDIFDKKYNIFEWLEISGPGRFFDDEIL